MPCTPYALVHWPEGTTTELIAKVAEQLLEKAPREAGRLKLPAYKLISSLSGAAPVLKDRAWAAHRGAQRSRPPGDGGSVTVSVFPFTVTTDFVVSRFEELRRWAWEQRWTVRLRWSRYRHLWPTGFSGKRTYGAALSEFDAVRTGGGDEWDGLLLAALMTDLFAYARQGILHPGRRRRRPRHVLLLNGTAEANDGTTAGADAVDTFVSLYNEKQTAGPHPVAVLVAALPPVEGVVADPQALDNAAKRLNPAKGDIPVRLDVTPPPPDPAAGIPVPVIWKPFARLRPPTEVFFETAAVVVALWLGGQLAFLPWIGPGPIKDNYTGCLEGGSNYSESGEVKGGAKHQYAAASALIEEQNKVAEPQGGKETKGEADPARTVTIAHVRSTLAANEREGRSGGAIPELRGLAVAQELLHAAAPADNNSVWVKIRTYQAGVQYADAEKAARQIIKDAEKDPSLIGVTGFTESRTQTVAALNMLDKARIPIVSSAATAKAMEVGRYFHGAAPNSKRETVVAAKFIQEANTVKTGPGSDSCVPAEDVAVVTDPTDVYSDELGKDLAEALLPYKVQRIGYTPTEVDGPPPTETDLDMQFSMSQVADVVCGKLMANPRTLVYWTSRVREFDSFLDTFQAGACANKDLTVVGGNELTNAAFSGNFKSKSWLHLYHMEHMLPYGHPDRSQTAKDFSDQYRRMFGDNDLWLNDGHAALAHDTVRILADAASRASQAGTDLTRPNIQQHINGGHFTAEGASGLLEFKQGSLQRPYNKLLVMLHHNGEGSAPVLVCGDPGANLNAGRDWKQGTETYACPSDDEQ
ncbi:ABC transporter substrate-binding protein [Streptomyces sp. NPDC057137]|uniref:ABC transporter substrate-binding protein n=1 Tax=Streptomyces sp. NPDC057137 TaxID=3346030 RepID=UPI003641E86A